MFAATRSCSRILWCGSRVHYSTKESKFDPRSEKNKRMIMPWKYTKDHQPGLMERLFDNGSTTDLLKFLTAPIDLRGVKISSWLKRQYYAREERMQAFDEERLFALGSDLSAAHVFFTLGAGIKFKGKPWMKYDRKKVQQEELPDEYEDGWKLEAIDMSECPVVYEGCCHFRNLDLVHSLTAQNCPHLDDWCLDIIGSELLGLEVLDISGCESVTPNGLAALVRLPNLHTLDLSNCPAIKTQEGVLMCVLLQDYNQKLTIKGVEFPSVPGENSSENVSLESDVLSRHTAVKSV